MINTTKQEINIEHADGSWAARHDAERFGGPRRILMAGEPILEDCRFRLDGVDAGNAVLNSHRASRRGGAALVTSTARFADSRGPRLRQVCRYAANHLRVTFDLQWVKGKPIQRHLEIGSLFLPGQWQRFYCLPPLAHLAEGAKPTWHEIPAAASAPALIGHWHRPPLALVFERPNGTRVEVGTGYDVWRWESSLGHGPESGNYKILREANGLRLLREPLMCCAPFTPQSRSYRFSWYAAWTAPAPTPNPDHGAAQRTPIPLQLHPDGALAAPEGACEAAAAAATELMLDFRQLEGPASWKRVHTIADLTKGQTAAANCWQHSGVRNSARRTLRQLAARLQNGNLQLAGIVPGICWNAAHLDRRGGRAMAHWDIGSMLDFAVWTRQSLGPNWSIGAAAADAAPPLPVLAGLFGRNGFETEAISTL